jgi:hypothetical protein
LEGIVDLREDVEVALNREILEAKGKTEFEASEDRRKVKLCCG